MSDFEGGEGGSTDELSRGNNRGVEVELEKVAEAGVHYKRSEEGLGAGGEAYGTGETNSIIVREIRRPLPRAIRWVSGVHR